VTHATRSARAGAAAAAASPAPHPRGLGGLAVAAGAEGNNEFVTTRPTAITPMTVALSHAMIVLPGILHPFLKP